MKTSLVWLVPLLALGVHNGLAADKDKPSAPPTGSPPVAESKTVRLRFVPGGPPAKGAADFKGASQTALGPGPQKGVLWCQAHAGVGDHYPVMSKEGVTFFEVLLAEGDDDQVVLEIRSKEGAKKIDLPRDKPRSVEVAGIKYDFLYPSVFVAAVPGEKPTTNKAMLMVTRRL